MAVPGKKATKQVLLSTTSMSSDEDFKLYCQPCDQDGPRLPAHGYCTNCAEHLCETCFTLHRRHKLSRHHTLLDKADMPRSMSFVTPSQSDKLMKPCPKHNIEMIKFYYHDHEALLCSVCVTLDHTPTTCHVSYIPAVSGWVINSEKYQDISKIITGMTEEASKKLQNVKEMNDASNKSLADALTDIKRFRTQINQRLDELEKQVREAAHGIQEENARIITRIKKECEDLSQSMKASSDTITHLNSSKQANDLFIELKLAEQMIKDYEKNIAKLTIFDFKEYNFEPNVAISNLLGKEKSMGTLKGRSLSFKMKSRQLSHNEQCFLHKFRSSLPFITRGMTLLTPNLLTITDIHNMALIMFDISKKSVLNVQKIDGTPTDVSSVSQDEIVVTIPDNQTIQFMSVAKYNFKKKQTIKVDGRCLGICCHTDKMVVLFSDPAKVQILLTNGTVLQTIQDEDIFKYPGYVTTNDNYIYVSDTDMKTVSKLNWQGEVKRNYFCKSTPSCLTTSDDGTVFVCYDDDTIKEISEDFTKEQIVIEGVQYPAALCWSTQTCTLYACMNIDDIEDFIEIFKFFT